jgi:2-polyprenyl-6-methoxyphenol hydroxylase-like FAD-dependent oxidoreductase
LVLGKTCAGFEQQSSDVTVIFKDGTKAQADYLVGCDGIHSAIRKMLLPESHPRYAGYTCWRGVIDDIPENVNMGETSESWGPGSRFGIAPLSNNRIYWFACLNARQNDPFMKSLTLPSLLIHFNSYHFPVREILQKTRTEELIWADIIDLKPIKNFAFGRVVLMGDAAHATTPNMGQGACLAIEDAATLANALEQCADGEEAFIHFERKRIARTTKIVNNSRTLGQVAQWENPLLTGLRNTMLKLTPARVTEKQVKFLTDVSFN